VVEYRGVSKRYPNGTLALNNINLTINKGEFAFFVGPSGSGKSTLLKLILKEEDPTEGEVFVNGYELSKMTRKRHTLFKKESWCRISGF